jgi:hypothetical protein
MNKLKLKLIKDSRSGFACNLALFSLKMKRSGGPGGD